MAGGTRLTLEERERLAALKAEGLSLRAIARGLGRAASTVSRELRRNAPPKGGSRRGRDRTAAPPSRELRRNAPPKGGYLPVHAEGCYRERRQRPAVLERDAKLARLVRERLLAGWAPQQIGGRLARGGGG